MKRLFGCAVAGAMVLRAYNGWACSPPLIDYTVAGVTALGGDRALLDTPILVEFTASFGSGETPTFFDPMLTLTRVDSGAPVAVDVKMSRGAWDEDRLYSFVPARSLEPDTTYEVSVVSGDTGAAPFVKQFITGSQSREPLELEGELGVTLEQGEDARMNCEAAPGSCGGSCVPDGVVSVTKARAKIPAVSGGYAGEHVEGKVIVADIEHIDGARSFGGLGEFSLDLVEGQAGELVFTMPGAEGAKPYQPCFVLVAQDARGDEVASEPLCLPEQVEPLTTDPDGDSKPRPVDNGADDGAKSPRTSAGCSVAAPSSAGSLPWLFLAVTLGAAARKRWGRR